MTEPVARRRLMTLLLALAIFAAPFLGLLFDVKAALGLMAAALGTTTLVVREASRSATGIAGRWLNVLAGVNSALALACVAALIWLFAIGR